MLTFQDSVSASLFNLCIFINSYFRVQTQRQRKLECRYLRPCNLSDVFAMIDHFSGILRVIDADRRIGNFISCCISRAGSVARFPCLKSRKLNRISIRARFGLNTGILNTENKSLLTPFSGLTFGATGGSSTERPGSPYAISFTGAPYGFYPHIDSSVTGIFQL